MTTRMLDDLTMLKDDMKAFVEGHGMRRFQGYVNDEISSVMWDPGDNADSWKDFVELAKASNAPFLTMNDVVLEREDVDYLVNQMQNSTYINDEDVEEAKWLRTYIGKTGFVQIGFPYQGTMFLCEVSTEWYDRYQRLLEMADEYGGIPFDELEGSDGKDDPF
jgi:virulence-associated protein VapD